MKRGDLWAPESYWNLSPTEKYNITNGCGPRKSMGLIPNFMFGINIRSACDIHDFTYARPSALGNRMVADRLFLLNMKILIERERTLPILLLGYLGAVFFYLGVRIFGKHYFGLYKIENAQTNVVN